MLKIDQSEQYTHPKIESPDSLSLLIEQWKSGGKSVGLCHGGFDLLHPGHVKHFESARTLCDVLVVSVTADAHVASRKGTGRPVFPDSLRAYMIANLAVIDRVVISPYKTGVEIINILKPSRYIKGPDFIGKETPGIIAERSAINAVGGDVAYTNDPPSSTTAIIDYIKHDIDAKKLLVVTDRDGTLIQEVPFIGKDVEWKEQMVLNKPVIDFLSFLKTKYQPLMVVATNQAGVARGYFSEEQVRVVNAELDQQLRSRGITIPSWQFAPEVDEPYALSHPEIAWNPRYVVAETTRKPSARMAERALMEQGKKLSDFARVIVLGDRHEDAGLATALSAQFFDVRGKTFEELVAEFGDFT